MRLLSIVHLDTDPPGLLGQVAAERGHAHDEWWIHAGAPPPGAPEEYDAVAIFGGDMAVQDEDAYPWLQWEKEHLRRVLARGVPVFGVCLGGQLLADVAGAAVTRAERSEIGWYDVDLTPDARGDPIFSRLPDRFPSFQWHSWKFDLPDAAVPLARDELCLQAYRLGETAWGVQFHPEVVRAKLWEWLQAARTNAEAQAIGFDYEAERERSERNVGRWNAIGRTLFGGFLDAAERQAALKRRPVLA